MDDLIFGRINTDMVRPSVPCMIHDLSQPHCRTHQTSVSWHLERFSPLWWNDLWIKRLCSSGYRIGLPRAPLVLWLLLPGMLTITNWIIIAKVVKEVSLGELLWLQFIEKCRSLTCLLFWPLRHQWLCRMRLSLSLIAPRSTCSLSKKPSAFLCKITACQKAEIFKIGNVRMCWFNISKKNEPGINTCPSSFFIYCYSEQYEKVFEAYYFISIKMKILKMFNICPVLYYELISVGQWQE